jgi:hypothetical protein
MITMGIVTDPQEIAAAEARRAALERNVSWFQAHAAEICRTYRGKCICVAGQQLFVADSPQEAIALARAAHPEDQGDFVHYIPKESMLRIYYYTIAKR